MAIFNYNSERPFRGNPDLHLHYWGREQCLPGHFFGPGVRDVYKIHFIHEGTGKVSVGEQTHILQAGQAFLTYPHIVTSYAADLTNPWIYSWVAFTGEQVSYILSKTSLTPEQPIFPMDKQLMPNLYERLTEAADNSDCLDLPLKAIMYEFFSLLLQAVPAVPDVLPLPRQRVFMSSKVSTFCIHIIVRTFRWKCCLLLSSWIANIYLPCSNGPLVCHHSSIY